VGDAFLVDFPSVVHAVQCARQIQMRFRTHNADKAATEQIHVRIGIHSGDIVQKDRDVFGDGVNTAKRLQELTKPDTICLSDVVYRDVAKKLDLGTVVSLGRPQLKNIAERFPVYALLPQAPQGVRQQLQVQRLKLSRRVRPVVFVLVSVLLLAGIIAVHYSLFPILGIRHSELGTQEAQPPLPLPDKPSIVILPFVNMSEDPKQEYFSDGITEDITADLSKISSLFVIARNSAFTYKGKAVKMQDVSREMGVRYVLEGSVRKAGDQVRVTTQLIDATTGGHLWSERYDRPFSDIFALQDEIRQKIVFALKVKLTPEEQERFQYAPTNDLEAYDFYLRGRESFLRALYEGKKEANAQARQMFEKAVELDPQYAGAYAGLGMTYWTEWVQYGGSEQTLEQAFALAQKAVALDDSVPMAHVALGFVYLRQKHHDQAQTEMERAITLNPNFATGYQGLSFVLQGSGKPQEAIAVAAQAVRLDPQHLPVLNALGQAYVSAGQYEEAIAIFKKILARNPDHLGAHSGLAIVYSELGKEEEARAAGAEILRINPNFSVEGWKQRSFYKDPAVTERCAAALRKAGLK
jgi:TolB-like protein/Tfp pilus assembly protein PilF